MEAPELIRALERDLAIEREHNKELEERLAILSEFDHEDYEDTGMTMTLALAKERAAREAEERHRTIFSAEQAQIEAPLLARIKELEERLSATAKELALTVHKVITCGVAATHPDANLTKTGAYASKWNSQQAESVRMLRAERDSERAAREEAEEDARRYRWLRDATEMDGAGVVTCESPENDPVWYESTGQQLDTFIDAALEQAEREE